MRNVFGIIFGLFILIGCRLETDVKADSQETLSSISAESPATALLKNRNEEFNKDILKLTDRVYTAVGYSVSPISMIVGDQGVIIVDTGIHADHSRQVLEEFRKITAKPVNAIIYTHGHGDHTLGATTFVADGSKVQIYASHNYGIEARNNLEAGLNFQKRRGIRQSGFLLPKDKRINNGVAKAVWLKKQAFGANVSNTTSPNNFITETVTKTIEGVKIEFSINPGETKDQLMLWLPDEKAVFAGDNFYKSWPNLYAIRGTAYRDVKDWAQSIARVRSKNADVLVGGHTRPIIGRANVEEVLSNYEKAIRFVFDKTIEGMNKGLTPDELVNYVQLPDDLAQLDYLKPYYGHPDWAVRSIYSGYLGWFDGNPTNLFPMSPTAEAENIAKLSGGIQNLQKVAARSLNENPQWAAQICDWILVLEPENADAKRLKANALELLGDRLLTATGRNYYFTTAQELRASIAE